MITIENFEQHVHTALLHLYDHAYLEGHALAQSLPSGSTWGTRGQMLRRLLLDAIQDLKPPREAPSTSLGWHHYQYLYLRYVLAKPVVEIADQLAVTERQTRRRHRDALEALARVLWEGWRNLAQVEASTGGGGGRSSVGVDVSRSAGRLLESELERITSIPSRESIDVTSIVDSALATVVKLAEIHGAEIKYSRPESRIDVVGDRVVIRQALLEVLAFVIQRGNGARVDVSIAPDAPQLVCKIYVRGADQPAPGRGDSPGDQVFAEIQQLIQAERGALRTRSEGVALVVELDLPMLRPSTTLVVDDNPDMLQLYRRFLSGSPYLLIEARSGDEALAIAGELQPDAVILDVMMPDRDGWEILQALRRLPATSRVPIIVCSVLRQQELALSLGATTFLAKPVTQQALLSTLERCHGRGH